MTPASLLSVHLNVRVMKLKYKMWADAWVLREMCAKLNLVCLKDADACECGNELSDSLKCREFLD